MLILDFNQIFFSNIMMHFKNEAREDNPNGRNLLKHMVLSTIVSYKNKYGREFGEPVLALDNRSYWRRDVFPHYKGKRKAARDKSDLDWAFIFKSLDEIKADLRENFPYKIVEVEGAEADDVIACLVRYLQENELVQTGLMEEPQPVMIISADTDFCQLQRYPNVKQYSPMQKKAVKPQVPLKEFVMDHICAGDAGDGIPNICSADDCFMTDVRQTPFRKSRLPEFLEHGIEACKDDTEKARFQRNQMLVDFDHIPHHICEGIVQAYINQKPVKAKQKIFNYLMKNRMKHLLENVNDF